MKYGEADIERFERLRREKWRHQVRLETLKTMLEADLREGAKIDADALIETADQFAMRMYPEPK